jgi:hypothetical protein
MLTAWPQGCFAFEVTLQTNVILFVLWFRRFGFQGINTAPFAFFSMSTTRTMTRLTDEFLMPGSRCPRVSFDSMNGLAKTFVDLLMTFHTRFIAHIVIFYLTLTADNLAGLKKEHYDRRE